MLRSTPADHGHRRPTPTTAALASIALAGGLLLTGCGAVGDVVGGDDTESYCEDVRAAQEEFAGLSGDAGSPADAEEIESGVQTFRDLGDASPEEVADDWEVVGANLDEREAVLDDAGLTWGDLASVGPDGELPDGVTSEDLSQVGTRLSELNTPEFQEANANITAHAEEECGIDAPELPQG